ncbi:MAG: response regulator [Gammaproteobacteria bacterium]|nr:response regulator [Gammaproteobacteria bacterium]
MYISDFWQLQLFLGSGLLLGMVLLAIFISRQPQKPENTTSETASGTTDPIGIEPSEQNTENENHQKVLLITPDVTDRHMLLNFIDSWGIQADVCNSAVRGFAELLNAASSGNGYSTVIVDSLNLDMDPIQFSRSLRLDNALHTIHLIHISPGHNSEHEAQLIGAGYSRVLNTPLDKTILFDALHITEAKSLKSNNITRLINHYSSKEDLRQPIDILLATPDLDEQKSLRSILEQDGQRVYSVDSGSQALDALNTHQFDMVIIDFNLSDINGRDVIRLHYYTYLNQEWMPFIALVDEAATEIISECRETGVAAILIRPISEQKLLSTVSDIATSRTGLADNIDNYNRPLHNHNTPTKDNGNPALNIQTIMQLEHLSPNDNFLDQLISEFNHDVSQLLDAIERSIETNRFTEFKDLSHALRDSSCNIGADSLHCLSLRALQINRHNFQKQATQIAEELHVAQSKTEYALHNYVIRRDNSALEKE